MRWTEQKAWEWQKRTGRLVGFNYVTSTAVNSTEMWQTETFDSKTIKRELELGAKTGYNSCRIFLQYIVWEKERDSFLETLGEFCKIAASTGISVMPILFDDCAFSGKEPYWGKQKPPSPGVHNSGWTPSPGKSIADNPEKEQDLCDYVKNVIGSFKDNKCIAIWDLYNEPGNNGRKDKCLPLLEKSFEWARSTGPVQPLTAGIWEYKDYDLSFAGLSDIISYHDYCPLAESEKKIELLKKYNRPLLCTEWLHRQGGNTFQNHLPLYNRENIGIYNWGLVNGKTQTHLDWSTMNGTPDASPKIWQHDIFYPDGAPYDENEIELIRRYK